MPYMDPASVADSVIDAWVDNENDELLMRLLDSAAELLAKKPPDRWAGWIVYFAEALDSKEIPDFEDALRAAGRDFMVRLETGQW